MTKLDYRHQSAFFNENYTRLAYYELDGDKEIMLGDETLQRCRFCGEERPIFFRKKAHVIPHFIGNRALKSLYECDKCNERFCEMESHFSNYMAFFHILSRIGRGNKKPVYKNNSKSKIVVEENNKDIYLHSDDENIKVDINREEKTLTIHGVRSYVPIFVYKIFIKMALTIMPESEMKYFQFTNKWLMIENIEIQDMRLSIRMYNSIESFNGSCVIYKRNDDCKENMPCYLFGLKYNNFYIQTYIPLCYQDTCLHGKISMPLIPCTFDKKGINYIRYLPDLSSHNKISKENVSLKFDVGDWAL